MNLAFDFDILKGEPGTGVILKYFMVLVFSIIDKKDFTNSDSGKYAYCEN